jgi:ankyrin repeat protein
VDVLLANDGIDPHSNDKAGRTPLSYAAETGQKEVVELLLAKGADPDLEYRDGECKVWTPLLFAASNGHKEVVELLLAKSADLDSEYTNKEYEVRMPL